MSFSNLEFDVNNFIASQIADFKNHIQQYQETINTEGIWLFLAVLGCWGVTDEAMQKTAFIVTMIIFAFRVYQKLEDTRSFREIYLYIEEQVKDSNLDEDLKKARLYDLNRVKNKNLRFSKLLKSSSIFIICFVYTIFSMALHFSNS
jgi:hypothetical protein